MKRFVTIFIMGLLYWPGYIVTLLVVGAAAGAIGASKAIKEAAHEA